MAELVETTTYEIASDALFHKPLLPEERLWRSVIINALEDFQNICIWAELQPDAINYHYRTLLKSGVVRFQNKQIMWYQYDLFSKTLQNVVDECEKKALRRKIRDMREVIYTTPSQMLSTIFLSVLS